MVDNELRSVTDNGKFRSRDEVDTVYKLIDVAKDVYCIWTYEDEMESGYSEAYGGYPSRYNVAYDDGYSNARGRGRNANRYADGRYAPSSRNGSYNDGGSYEGGSYRGGRSYRGMNYSRDDGNREYVDNLRMMMQDAPDDQTRQSIQRMIDQMEQR